MSYFNSLYCQPVRSVQCSPVQYCPVQYCRVEGCTWCLPGQPHYCKNCNVLNVAHFSRYCCDSRQPDGSVILCRVIGCIFCLPDASHYCKVCRQQNVDHRSAKCPLNFQNSMTQPLPLPPSSQLASGLLGCTSNLPVSRSRSVSHSRYLAPASTQILKSSIPVRASAMPSVPSVPSAIALPTTQPQFASMTMLVDIAGVTHMVFSLRADSLSCPNTPTTYGGSIDQGENSLQGALRECKEESGTAIDPSKIIHMFRSTNGKSHHYIAHFVRMPHIKGPDRAHAWEVTSSVPIHNVFDRASLSELVQITDLIWAIPVRTMLKSRSVWEHSLINTICKEIGRQLKYGGPVADYVL